MQTFLCERNFYFFSPCVKYVFDFLRPPPPSFSGFFVLFGGSRMQVDVGRLQTFPKSENFFACSLFCTAVFSLVTVGDGHFHTFYIEKIFTFFLACVKYTYECHRLSLPSFSGFFVLFGGSRMQVDVGRLQTFPKSENFFACSLFCTAVFSLVTVGDGHFHTFYIEKIFTFFLACVKYTYECHRLSLPSFSGFFALFL